MPMDKRRYPANWPEISRATREKAGWRCEWCGAANGQPHPITGSKVVLTVHHIGAHLPDGSPGDPHDKMDVRPCNLVALCQRCHLRADLASHLANRRKTLAARRAAARSASGQKELITE